MRKSTELTIPANVPSFDRAELERKRIVPVFIICKVIFFDHFQNQFNYSIPRGGIIAVGVTPLSKPGRSATLSAAVAPKQTSGVMTQFPRECSGRAISRRCGFPHRSAMAQTDACVCWPPPPKDPQSTLSAAARCKTPPRARRNGCSVRRRRQRECAPNVPQMSAALTDRSSSRPQSTRQNGLTACAPRARRSVGRSVGRSVVWSLPRGSEDAAGSVVALRGGIGSRSDGRLSIRWTHAKDYSDCVAMAFDVCTVPCFDECGYLRFDNRMLCEESTAGCRNGRSKDS